VPEIQHGKDEQIARRGSVRADRRASSGARRHEIAGRVLNEIKALPTDTLRRLLRAPSWSAEPSDQKHRCRPTGYLPMVFPLSHNPVGRFTVA
jgi:hypothetical protein